MIFSGDKCSARNVAARKNPDGSVVPASTPIRLPNGSFARPPSSRKGCEWDYVRGVWVPIPGYQDPLNVDGNHVSKQILQNQNINKDKGVETTKKLQRPVTGESSGTNEEEGESTKKRKQSMTGDSSELTNHDDNGECEGESKTKKSRREDVINSTSTEKQAENHTRFDGEHDKAGEKKDKTLSIISATNTARNEPEVVVIDLIEPSSTVNESIKKNEGSPVTSSKPPSYQQSQPQKKLPPEKINSATSGDKNQGISSNRPPSYQQSETQKKLSPEINVPNDRDKKKETTKSDKVSLPLPNKDTVQSTALPLPLPNNSTKLISFLPDNSLPPVSGSLDPRPSCTLSYISGWSRNGVGASLDDKSSIAIRERIERFDPYWKVVKELGRVDMPCANGKKTKVSTRTSACLSATGHNISYMPTSCAMVTVVLPSEYIEANETSTNTWGVKWGTSSSTYQTGDRRLLLRMIPLKRTEKDQKRSDTHQWPRGTFVQIDQGVYQRVLPIVQRRQQKHDPKDWKGLSRPLDLTSAIPDASSHFNLKICTREVIETPKHTIGSHVSKLFEDDDGEEKPFSGIVKSYDEEYKLYQIVYEDDDSEELTYAEVSEILVKKSDSEKEEANSLLGSYAIHLAVCEYISPDDLHEHVQGNMTKVSLKASQEMAKKYLENQTVSIDSDSDNGGNDTNTSSLTFSLLCPISKMTIGTPVRGRSCKHMQCFDLKSFLHGNQHVSGGRWRCGVCEDFLSVSDLVQCGLFEAMLQKHRKEVSGIRDQVSFRPGKHTSWICL